MFKIYQIELEEEIRAAVLFFAEELQNENYYITSGEIKYRRSENLNNWAENLKERLFIDLWKSVRTNEYYMFKISRSEKIYGFFALYLQNIDGLIHVVLDDLLIGKNVRKKGLGKLVVNFVEKFSREKNAKWIFVEVGAKNFDTQLFFERNNFEFQSKIYGKELR